MSDLENFRDNLRRVIEHGGLSQDAYADQAEVSKPYLNRILKGHASPSVEICSQLAKPSGFTLRDLFLPPREFRELFDHAAHSAV